MNTDKNAIGEHHLFGESANSRKLFQIRVYLCLSVVKLLFPGSVWQRSINRWQKVLRMKRVWWNCCIEIEAAAKQFLEERSSILKCQERTPVCK
jgi:hypothetical protein